MAVQNVEIPLLYQVNLYELQKSNEFNTKLMKNLADISANVFDSAYLKKLSTDSRAILYVLADSSLNLHCALQVYLEGNVPDMSNEEDMAFGMPIHKGFHYFRSMLPEDLYGARIVTLFPLLLPQPQPQEQDYTSIALDKLLRFLKEGVMDENLREEGSLVKLKKSWPKLHYIGICKKNINDLQLEELVRLNNCGFSPLIAGHMEYSASSLSFARNNCAIVLVKMWEVYDRNQLCTLSSIAEVSQGIFLRLLRCSIRDLSPYVALRIIKSFAELKDKNEPCEKLWNEFDDLQVSTFINHPQNFEKFELVSHLVLGFGAYFLDKIPAILSEQEETILLEMCGKAKTLYEAAAVLNLSRPNAMDLIASCFEKVQHYFNNLTPEVID